MTDKHIDRQAQIEENRESRVEILWVASTLHEMGNSQKTLSLEII